MRPPAQTSSGFTLIEVMAVVAVVTVMATIAFPTYQNYRARAERSIAQQLVSLLANRQAQYLSYARNYTDETGPTGLNLAAVSIGNGWACAGATCTNTQYTVTIAVNNAATPPTFLITATPKTGSLVAGDPALTMDSTGARSGPWKR